MVLTSWLENIDGKLIFKVSGLSPELARLHLDSNRENKGGVLNERNSHESNFSLKTSC
jgi:hypothetical protein